MQQTVTAHFGPSYREVTVGNVVRLAKDKPLRLDCGAEISDFPIAYQTYGTLNADASNAILVCHGLTGDQYLIGEHPVTARRGWWELMAGPELPLDTNKYFIICSNVMGGCMGSFGPKDINRATGKPYNLEFPVLTIGDMVKAQKLLVEHFGIKKLLCVVGGSMGGMLALDWSIRYPDMMHGVIPIATAARHNAQNIAFDEIGRQAIMADPDWAEGNYINERRFPAKGLAVARMTAHVTYLSQAALHSKFGRSLQDRTEITFGFEADYQVESYLRHQGHSFVERFDPNAYLYITRAMDYFDLAGDHGGQLSNAFAKASASFCVVSFTSDWLFPTAEVKNIVHALNSSAANVSFVEIESDKGHDAFLLEEPSLRETISGFLKQVEKRAGLKRITA